MLKRRADLKLTRKAAAGCLGIDEGTVKNWECGRTRPDVRFYPAVISFLGYNPLPEPESAGAAIVRARTERGHSRKRLGEMAGVDEATVGRLEQEKTGTTRQSADQVFSAAYNAGNKVRT